MAILAFDFDGVITVDHKYPECGQIRRGIRECITNLILAGHTIVIWTCRSPVNNLALIGYDNMVRYLGENAVQYHCINKNVRTNENFMSYPKIGADVYIDDCGLGWDDRWDGDDIYRLINAKLVADKAKVDFHNKLNEEL